MPAFAMHGVSMESLKRMLGRWLPIIYLCAFGQACIFTQPWSGLVSSNEASLAQQDPDLLPSTTEPVPGPAPSNQPPPPPVPGPSPLPAPTPTATAGPRVKTGTPVENFGAVAFYSEDKFFGKLDVEYVNPSLSRIIYRGNDAPFTAEYLGKELVLFRAHENPIAPDGQKSFYPGKVTARYSRVSKIVDGRQVEVDFGYNGGSLSAPRRLAGASGYFFHDNRLAFVRAFNSADRMDRILLKSGAVYVTKGAWDAAPVKALDIESDGPARAAIKMSIEDAFVPLEGTGPGIDAFRREFGSQTYFTLGNNNFSVRFNGIDLLPSYYHIRQTQPGSGTFFFHRYSDAGECRVVRELSVTDSNSLREFDRLGERHPNLPRGYFVMMPLFGYSLCGGTDDGKDVTDMQVFRLRRADWVGNTLIEIKNNYFRAGNLLHVEGKSPTERSKLFGNHDGSLGRIPDLRIQFVRDEVGEYRKVRILGSDATAYEMANLYWNGGLSTGQTHRFEFPEGDVRFGGARDYDYIEGVRKWPRDLLIDAKALRVAEGVPTLGKNYRALQRLEARKLRIDGLMILKNDVLRIGGLERRVVGVVRGYDDTVGNFLDVEVEADIGADLDFQVIASGGQKFLADGGAQASFIYDSQLVGYLMYTSKTLNLIIENVDLDGQIRASTHLDGPVDDQHLWKQAKYRVFRNAHYSGSRLKAPFGAANEFIDSNDLFVRSRLTGVPHRVIIDASTVYWARKANNVDEIMLMNRPTLFYGNTSVGGPRFVGGIYQDGKGFRVNPDGDEFQFEAIDNKQWDLSNVEVIAPSNVSCVNVRVSGWGTILLNGLRRAEGQVLGFPRITFGPPHAYPLNQPGDLKILAQGGEGAIGEVLSIYPKGLENTRVDLRAWNLGAASHPACGGNQFPASWKNQPIYPTQISISP